MRSQPGRNGFLFPMVLNRLVFILPATRPRPGGNLTCSRLNRRNYLKRSGIMPLTEAECARPGRSKVPLHVRQEQRSNPLIGGACCGRDGHTPGLQSHPHRFSRLVPPDFRQRHNPRKIVRPRDAGRSVAVLKNKWRPKQVAIRDSCWRSGGSLIISRPVEKPKHRPET